MLFLQSAHRPKIHASRCVPRFFAWPPKFFYRPHRKHGQAMGGMNLEDFLAGGGGGMAMAAMGGLLLSMALGDH